MVLVPFYPQNLNSLLKELEMVSLDHPAYMVFGHSIMLVFFVPTTNNEYYA